jgi:Transposase IS66 family
MWSIPGKRAEELTALRNVIAADFQGTLQCDAYVAYGSFVRKHARKITLAGCWAHVRRNFYEAREQAPQRCGWILRQIAHLYGIEDTLRRSQAGPNKRAAVRLSQSRPDLPAPAPRSGPLQKVPPLSASQRFWPGHRLRALQLAVTWHLSREWPNRDR